MLSFIDLLSGRTTIYMTIYYVGFNKRLVINASLQPNFNLKVLNPRK